MAYIDEQVDRLARLQQQAITNQELRDIAKVDPVSAVILAGDRGLNYADPYTIPDKSRVLFDPAARTMDRVYYELWRRSVWVRACVSKIADEVVKKKFRVLWENDETHEIAKALRLWLDEIGGDKSLEELVKAVMKDVLTYGKGFLVFRDNLADGELQEIYRLDPRITDPITDKRNQLLFFRQEWSGEEETFTKEEVIYFYIEGPAPYIPQSPLITLMYTATADIGADRFNVAFFRNATNVGMVFKSGGNPDLVERNRLYMKETYSKPENAFIPMIMEGDTDLVRDGTAVVKDVSWAQLSQLSRHKICAIYDTPESELGISEDVNRNVKQGLRQSWLESCIVPWQEYACSVLTKRLCRDKLHSLELSVEPPARSRYITEEEANVSASIARRGATINEIRAVTQHPPVPGGDQLVVFIDGVGYAPLNLPLEAPMDVRNPGQGVPTGEMPEEEGVGQPVQESTVWYPLPGLTISTERHDDIEVPDWAVTDEDIAKALQRISEDEYLSPQVNTEED